MRRSNLGGRQSVPRHDPLALRRGIAGHDNDAVERARASGLEQQRDVRDREGRIGASPAAPEPRVDCTPHGGVYERFERGAGRGVRKDEPPQPGAIE